MVWRKLWRITPYVRWGNASILLLLVAMLAYAWTQRNTTPLPQAGEGWGEGIGNNELGSATLLRCATTPCTAASPTTSINASQHTMPVRRPNTRGHAGQ